MSPAIRQHCKQILVILIVYTVWCVAVFLFLVGLQGLATTLDQFGKGRHLYINFIHSIIKGVVVYYILIYWIVLPSIKNRRWKKTISHTLLFFTLLTIYEYIWIFKTGSPTQAESQNMSVRTFFLTLIMLDFLVVLVSIFSATLITSNELRKRKQALEKEKLMAELSAIKYQINPHFLFNSLSFIYTKTLKTSPEAAQAVHLLSEIMSYALDDWDELGTVPIALEIDQMKRVIEMNQIRFSQKLNIKYDEEVEDTSVQIPILTLVTLVENAFKHGELNDEKNRVTIELKADKSGILFMVRNKKKKGPKEPSKGIGLSNVRQRLHLVYGDRHTFVIKEDDDYYMNQINITL